MSEALVLIGLPQATADLLRMIASKTGDTMVDVLSKAIEEKALKHLTKDDFKKAPKR